MATLLVTQKMPPALAARVERAVSGRDRPLVSRRLVAMARFGLVIGLALAAYGLLSSYRRDRRTLEAARLELLSEVERRGAVFGPRDRDAFARAEAWLPRVAALEPPAERIPAELREAGALQALLARPLLYVRGELDGLSTSERVAAQLSESRKDTLLVCLKERPAGRDERALMQRVYAAFDAAVLEQSTANVRRLEELPRSLPWLEPDWADEIQSAETPARLAKLRAQLESFDVDRAKALAQVGLLLVVVDEPGDPRVPASLDGERPHVVRLALVDLEADRLELFVRVPVDPGWISEQRRALYARELNGCAAAYEVHERLTAAR